MGLFLGVFVYFKDIKESEQIAHEKLHTLFEVVDISLLEGSFDTRFLKDLQRRSGVGVVIFDKDNQQIHYSQKNLTEISLNFQDKPQFTPLKLNDQAYLSLTQSTIIDGRNYDIGVFLPYTHKINQGFWIDFLVLFGVFLSLGVCLVLVLKRHIQNELGKIAMYLQKLGKKDFKKSLRPPLVFKEFAEISERIGKLGLWLQKQEKISKKRSKKLHLKYLQSTSIIAALSHEFKNPLAVISGYCEMILNPKAKELDSKNLERFLSKIYAQSQRLNQLLERLNLAVRLDNDLLQLETSSFDLSVLTEEITISLQARYPEKKITLTLKNTPIQADRVLIENVIINLVENALKYSKSKVAISVKKGRFEVCDDGCGIAEGQVGLVTKKFYRLQENYSQNSLGLGLFIVKYILKLHHSELEIKSTLGKGSCFSFKLPSV
ncbi:HAMP domain-containing sensor histidine kinase [Helicobacter sp. 12S02634-8]|uniref:sensor histidine kinase n=1 Tax=Helicobacter sp. 12S02634-8 TaxID=1476199 RepID=UPI0015571B75|nr:HAMP domain-containing sensor histidine kinase [Helicobacter sp. 12S02634-8]